MSPRGKKLTQTFQEKKNGFPRPIRLRLAKDFEKVYKEGKKYVSEHIILYVLDTHSNGLVKAAFVTSKRVGQAHQRNLIRRIMREVFRRQKDCFSQGLLLIFIARAEGKNWTFINLMEEIKQMSKRI